MKYALSNPKELFEAEQYFKKLKEAKAIMEIKKVSPKRTLSQNSYLHLILSAFGANFGYTLEEAKQIYKDINKTTYEYTKENRGKTRTFYRSSAKLSKEEMAKTIDNLMKVSSEAGFDLPLAEDTDALRYYENLVEQDRRYL